MKNLFILLIVSSLFLEIAAQSTGNVIYNSNNRFYMNSSYRSSASGTKYKSAAPTVSHTGGATFTAMGTDYSGIQSFWTPQTQEMVININVLFNAKPTGYMAIFHINQAGKKISDLDTMVSQRVRQFMKLAKAIGIGPENFYTDMIALVPIFEQGKRNNPKPKGFELQKNLHVKYKDPAQLDKLFSMAAQCEIYDLIKVEYLYDYAEKAGSELRTKAQQVLQTKLDFYKKLGVTLDTAYRTISENGNVIFPIDRYTAYQPLAVSSLDEEDKPSTGTDMMKTNVGIIQRSTVFYNPADCLGYDAIINPNPLEPPVQFTYTLQVKYRTSQPISQAKTIVQKEHEILIVTPGGDIKTINK